MNVVCLFTHSIPPDDKFVSTVVIGPSVEAAVEAMNNVLLTIDPHADRTVSIRIIGTMDADQTGMIGEWFGTGEATRTVKDE